MALLVEMLQEQDAAVLIAVRQVAAVGAVAVVVVEAEDVVGVAARIFAARRLIASVLLNPIIFAPISSSTGSLTYHLLRRDSQPINQEALPNTSKRRAQAQ